MPTATLTERDNITFAGPANHYRLNPPLRGFEHVTVFIEPAYGGMSPRVVIAPRRMDNEPMLNVPLPGSVSLHHEASIDDAAWFALLAAGGYEIVKPD
ncbi:hypothetical protein RCF19_13960 [Rhodococcus qingshengii]